MMLAQTFSLLRSESYKPIAKIELYNIVVHFSNKLASASPMIMGCHLTTHNPYCVPQYASPNISATPYPQLEWERFW